MTTVLTIGTFDLFHSGHVNLLSNCRDLAGKDGSVVVALNRDSFVERYKGKKPIVNYAGRATVLRSCRYVDLVVPNQGDEFAEYILGQIDPDYLAVGDDWLHKDYFGQLHIDDKFLSARNIYLVYFPYTEGISTTQLRADIG